MREDEDEVEAIVDCGEKMILPSLVWQLRHGPAHKV
jgi:hypothetical protein